MYYITAQAVFKVVINEFFQGLPSHGRTPLNSYNKACYKTSFSSLISPGPSRQNPGLLSKSEPVKFSLIESVICLFTYS